MNLSPEIIKMREALLERIGDKSLKEVAQIVNEILLNETDSTNRLAALAARVKVLRNYINKNYDIKNKSKKSELKNIKDDQPIKETTDNIDKNEDEGRIEKSNKGNNKKLNTKNYKEKNTIKKVESTGVDKRKTAKKNKTIKVLKKPSSKNKEKAPKANSNTTGGYH